MAYGSDCPKFQEDPMSRAFLRLAHRGLLAFLVFVAIPLSATPLTYDLVTQPNVNVFRPTDLGHAGDGRLFIASQPGTIRIVNNDQLVSQPFLDIQDRVFFDSSQPEGEEGLLGFAFHPNYAANGFVYVSYYHYDVGNNGNYSRVSRFTVSANDPNRTDPNSERIVLSVKQPENNHNMAQMRFGPDGYLYISTGDGGFANPPRCTGQQTDNLLGSVLRIDVDRTMGSTPYAIPPGNPFAAGPGRDEIWAYGLRNPWRISFDSLTGDLFIADAGQSHFEEINIERAGAPGGRNYGWKMMEGSNYCWNDSSGCGFTLPGCNDSVYTPPTLEYANDFQGGRCAVIGGVVYRGSAIPALFGTYVFGDFCGQMWAALPDGNTWRLQAMSPRLSGIIAFGEDVDGEIFIVTLDGRLSKIVDGNPLAGEPGTVGFGGVPAGGTPEGATARVIVRRTGGSDGAISVDYQTVDGTAVAGSDYVAATGTLSWGDEDSTDRTIPIEVLQDFEIEGAERFEVVLGMTTGGAAVAPPGRRSVTVADDDVPVGPCVPDPQTLCLNGDRFRVTVDWRDFIGNIGPGTVVPATASPDSGLFWFFNPNNWEFLVKVLDNCGGMTDHFWVFAAATTNVEYVLRVIDTQTGLVRVYANPLGVAAPAITDTQAFRTCP